MIPLIPWRPSNRDDALLPAKGGSHCLLELFGGLCGLLPRRRRQPSGGSARAEPVFPTKGEVATGGVPPARHGGWDARATRRGSRRN